MGGNPMSGEFILHCLAIFEGWESESERVREWESELLLLLLWTLGRAGNLIRVSLRVGRGAHTSQCFSWRSELGEKQVHTNRAGVSFGWASGSVLDNFFGGGGKLTHTVVEFLLLLLLLKAIFAYGSWRGLVGKVRLREWDLRPWREFSRFQRVNRFWPIICFYLLCVGVGVCVCVCVGLSETATPASQSTGGQEHQSSESWRWLTRRAIKRRLKDKHHTRS